MTDNKSLQSLHSIESSLNNSPQKHDAEETKDMDGAFFVYVGEEKKNDEESVNLHTDIVDQQAMFPRVSGATLMHQQQPQKHHQQQQQPQKHHPDQNSLQENVTLDSGSIYTNNNGKSTTSANHHDVEVKSTPSRHAEETTRTKGDTTSLSPTLTPSTVEDEVGSYMSVEVVEPPSAYPENPGSEQGPSSDPIIQVIENNNNSNADELLPTQEIVRHHQRTMTPPNMVTLNESSSSKPRDPDHSAMSTTSTDGSLYTAGHDASTITKDTFLKQQDYSYLEQDRQAYDAVMMVDPEAPQQEATPDYDAYYDPNAYGADAFTPPRARSLSEQQDEPSIGHSTITSLTKDTGILRTEEPDDELPVSRGILTGKDVSYLTPPRNMDKNKKLNGTPSTFDESGVVVGDEDRGVANNKDPNGGFWVFLQNATRDPTVQCLISLACIFAVILFFLVAVIIVLTSEDISI